MSSAPTKRRHRVVVEILFDEPVTGQDATRAAYYNLVSLPRQDGVHRRVFRVKDVKNFNRVRSAAKPR